jgi:hypothetical protein
MAFTCQWPPIACTCLWGADPTFGGRHDGGFGLAGGSTGDGQNGQKKKRHAEKETSC